MKNRKSGMSKTIDKKNLERIKEKLVEGELKTYFKELKKDPTEWVLSFLEAWEKKIHSLPFYLPDQIRNKPESFQLSQNEEKKLYQALAEFFIEIFKLEDIQTKVDTELLKLPPELPIRLGEKRRTLHLVPQENNLIDLALWFPSGKGIKKKEGDLKRDDLILKKGDTTLEFHRNISPPSMFTFRVCAICQDIWKVQGCPDSFFTSRKQIARMLNIVPEGDNLRQINIALSQLHNMSITAPFWLVNEKAKTKKQVLYKMTILLTHGEVKKDGQWAIELAFNPHLVRNLRKQKYTLLNMDFIKALSSPTAQRLYSKIRRQKGDSWSCSLHKIVDLCNLRGRRKKEIVEKAAEELKENAFLKSYKVEYSQRQHDLVFNFVKNRGVK